MREAVLALCVLAILATGCATTETGKPLQANNSASRVYSQPYERVYAAVLAAAKAEHLEVVEADTASGRIVLANPLTSVGWVETITVAVSRASAQSSEVKVISRRPLATTYGLPPNWGRIVNNRFGEFREAPSQRGWDAWDWGDILLTRIGTELASMR